MKWGEMSQGEMSRGEMSHGEKRRMRRNVAGRNVAGRNVAGRNVSWGETSHSQFLGCLKIIFYLVLHLTKKQHCKQQTKLYKPTKKLCLYNQ